MPVVKGFQKITGTIQNSTFYTVHGSDKVYLRTKGGPSKSMVENHWKFEKLRLNNSEWKGCTMMTKYIRESMNLMKPLEDYPVCGALNGISKQIQKTDLETKHGKRGIYLSKNRDLLGGFSVSKQQLLESVLRVPIQASIDRETGTAEVSIPSIDTNRQIYNFRKLPYFRIIVCLSRVSDVIFSTEKNQYIREHDTTHESENWITTDWFQTVGKIPAQNYKLALPNITLPFPDCITLILTFGFDFGKIGSDGQPASVKYAGCGKVIRVA
jgi:hypothetical protein